MWAVLKITDGTDDNTVDLLNGGWQLYSWRPGITMPKGGGVWQSSALSSGAKRVVRFWDNVAETIALRANRSNQDALIRDTQRLRRLGLWADNQQVTNWQDLPVYIVARGAGETETRYGWILDWQTPNDPDWMRSPAFNVYRDSAISDLILGIIREPFWRPVPPGESEAIALSVMEAYDSRNLGNVNDVGVRVPTTANEVYWANKRNMANLTHIFVWDAGFASWSLNLMDSVLPYTLWSAIPGVGDIVYFGIDTTKSDSGPFCSLVFDVGTPATYGAGDTITWEYSAAWAALPAWRDNTSTTSKFNGITPWSVAGVNSVHWLQPTGWTTAIVNGVTGYWVRCRITAMPTGITPATQQNRDIYTITTPYIEVQEDVVGGDAPALVKSLVSNESDAYLSNLTTHFYQLLIGRRSVDRGEDYTAYLNFADEQNPVGVTVFVGPIAAFATRVEAPTGRVITHTTIASSAWTDGGTVRFDGTTDPTIARQYFGEFRLFVRCYQSTGSAGDLKIRARIQSASHGATASIGQFTREVEPNANDFNALDLGKIHIPDRRMRRDEPIHRIDITVQVQDVAGAGGEVLHLYDIILMPVDEWVGELVDPSQTGIRDIGGYEYVDIDSLRVPDEFPAIVRVWRQDWVPPGIGGGYIVGHYGMRASAPMTAQTRARQRYWLFGTENQAGVGKVYDKSRFELAGRMQVEIAKQYFSAMGDG